MKKIFIFDMDGTLYDLNDVVKTNYDMQVKFLCIKKRMTELEATSFLEKNHIYPVMKEDSKSATEFFLQIGLDTKEWSDYRNNNCFQSLESLSYYQAMHILYWEKCSIT